MIGRCDLFVASRFHAMVSSLAMGVPTLVLGWSHKYREVLDMFGMSQWAMAASDVSTETVLTRLAELDAQRAEVATALGEALPRVRGVAMEQYDVIERVARGA